MGLVTDSCVRLGDDVAMLCSCAGVCGMYATGTIDGAVDAGCGGCDGAVAAGVGGIGIDAAVASAEGVGCGGGATAAAAMAAYRIGGSTAGATGRGADCVCSPALRIVAMGCEEKLRFSGGFATRTSQNGTDKNIQHR